MNRVIFPLDEMILSEARKWVSELYSTVAYFKVGLELYTAEGPKSIRVVGPDKCMLDLKYHDIPNTMEKACFRAVMQGVRFITVHADAGIEAMKRCVQATSGKDTDIVAVTILTSRPFDRLKFESLVNNAYEAGVKHFVCSPNESNSIVHLGKCYAVYPIIITPGISLTGEKRDDQVRVNTPVVAVRNGANYIVVGRPIRDASDPRAIIASINSSLQGV